MKKIIIVLMLAVILLLQVSLAADFSIESFRGFNKTSSDFVFEAKVSGNGTYNYTIDFGDNLTETNSISSTYSYFNHIYTIFGPKNISFSLGDDDNNLNNNATINTCINGTEIINNGIDEDCDGSDLEQAKIQINFPFLSDYLSSEHCTRVICARDVMLSFQWQNWIQFNINTSRPVNNCYAEAIEFENDFSNRIYTNNLTGSGTNWHSSAFYIEEDGLYNLTVYCNDSGKWVSQTTFSNNDVTVNYNVSNRADNVTFVYVRSWSQGLANFTSSPNYENIKAIKVNFTVMAQKYYPLAEKYGLNHQHFVYTQAYISTSSNITNYEEFKVAFAAIAANNISAGHFRLEFPPCEVRVDPEHENNSLYSCDIEYEYIINSPRTPYSDYVSISIGVQNLNGTTFYGSLFGDAYEWQRRAYVNYEVFKPIVTNIDPTLYPNHSSKIFTFYDLDKIQVNYSFQNTGEVVEDFNVTLIPLGFPSEKINYVDIQPGEKVNIIRNYTAYANCTSSGISSGYCIYGDGYLFQRFEIKVYPEIKENAQIISNYYNDIKSIPVYDFTKHAIINYIPRVGSTTSDYMIFETTHHTNDFNISGFNPRMSWYLMSINWLRDDSWSTLGELVINNTVDNYQTSNIGDTPMENYDCGNSSICYMTEAMDDEQETYYHHWNLKALSCGYYDGGSLYTFNVTAGNHEHDQLKFSVQQRDGCN